MKILFIKLLLLFSLLSISCDGLNKKVVLEDNKIGVISKIYIKEYNHHAYSFDLYDETGIHYFLADLYPGAWQYASIGDSIIKKKGDDFVTIKKVDGSFMEFKSRIK